MKKQYVVLSWVMRALVALGFLMASLGKLTNNPAVLEMFEDWGYPKGFHLFIGVVELALAIMILVPKTLKLAILGILIVMVGATLTHLINDPISNIIRPLIFLILTGGIYYLNFGKKRVK